MPVPPLPSAAAEMRQGCVAELKERAPRLSQLLSDAHPQKQLFEFPWPEFYYLSRDTGNAPYLVTSALMAPEAWAHKRVEEGDSIDAVVAQMVGDRAMSNAALLVAIDVVLPCSQCSQSRELERGKSHRLRG